MQLDIESNLTLTRQELEERVEKALYMVGLHWLRRVTEVITNRYNNARGGTGIVDTGRLRGSMSFATSERTDQNPPSNNTASDYIRGKADDNVLIVGTNVEYASDVELSSSSSRWGARPFLKPSIIEFKEEYEEIIEDTLKGNL